MSAPVLIMAGGTGGHVFPALAVARELQNQDTPVVWLGTRRGIEAELIPAAGIEIEWLRVHRLRGSGAMAWLLAPWRLCVALFDAIRVLRRQRPRAVLGMGGFASGPGGLAAWLLRKPLVIHEQNSVAGLTNRLLAGFAREVLTAFPGSFSSRVSTRQVGNPVRPEMFEVTEPRERLRGRTGSLRLLVLGGSQGALALNENVARAVALIAPAQRPEIRHQAGRATIDRARAAYRDAGVSASVEAFIDDMAGAYAWADLVVCRAGALTVAELAATGTASVLVPFPAAVDDHQTHNARFLADAGAAVLLPQSALTPETLAREIQACIEQRTLVLERAGAARALGQPAATRAVADSCLHWGASS